MDRKKNISLELVFYLFLSVALFLQIFLNLPVIFSQFASAILVFFGLGRLILLLVIDENKIHDLSIFYDNLTYHAFSSLISISFTALFSLSLGFLGLYSHVYFVTSIFALSSLLALKNLQNLSLGLIDIPGICKNGVEDFKNLLSSPSAGWQKAYLSISILALSFAIIEEGEKNDPGILELYMLPESGNIEDFQSSYPLSEDLNILVFVNGEREGEFSLECTQRNLDSNSSESIASHVLQLSGNEEISNIISAETDSTGSFSIECLLSGDSIREVNYNFEVK